MREVVIRRKPCNYGIYHDPVTINFSDLFWLYMGPTVHHPKIVLNAYGPRLLFKIN